MEIHINHGKHGRTVISGYAAVRFLHSDFHAKVQTLRELVEQPVNTEAAQVQRGAVEGVVVVTD